MTIKQKQALLSYLGYYDGPLDGLWGDKSQLATIDFQRAYMAQDEVDGIFGPATEKRILEVVATGEKPVDKIVENGVIVDTAHGAFWKDIRYFKRDEPFIACPCGECAACGRRTKKKLFRSRAVRAWNRMVSGDE